MAGETAEKIILHYESQKKNLLPAIKEISKRLGFLSIKEVLLLARYFRVKPAEVFSAASFYDQIKTKKPPRLIIQVCDSVNCQVKNSDKIVEVLEAFLKQKAGDDFSPNIKIEKISCLGHCLQGPNVVINGILYSQMDAGKVIEIVSQYI